MKRRLAWLAIGLGAWPALAQATEPAAPDLTVRSVPAGQRTPSLRIRKAQPPARPPARPVAQATPPAGNGPGATSIAAVPEGDGNPQARSWRDAEERIVFKVNAGFALDASPASGDAMRNGVVPADEAGDLATGARRLRTSNSYLLGDAVLGSRGLPRSSLNTYFSSQFRLGFEGASDYATRNDVWDSQNDADLLIQSAYGEVDDWGQPGDALHPLFLRAGRQFHYGSALFATQFDGLQLAWEQPDWEIGGFAGRRVALYQGDDPGIVAGASARVRLERMVGWPVALAFDAMSFDEDRTYLEAAARVKLGEARVTLTARALDNGDGDGFGVGRLSGRARMPWGKKLLLQADGDIILSHEVAYDYLSPQPVDVVNLSSSGIALALPEPGDNLRVGGGVLYTLAEGLEAYGFGRANLADAVGFDSTWIELGGALEAVLRSGLSAGAQFKLRAHVLDEATNAAGEPAENMTGSGVIGFKEAAAELRYRPGYHTYGFAAGGWLRSYDLTGPYVEITGDVRVGGRVDADYWIEKHARVRVIAEVAQPSPAQDPDLDTQFSVRFIGEASF